MNYSEIEMMAHDSLLDIAPQMAHDSLLDIAPQLALSSVRLETRSTFKEDCSWVGVTCRQRPEGIFYRVGPRHHYLMQKNGKKWAVRRAETMIRLLLKKLAREVAKP